MIYCLYNSETNALLGVDTEPMEYATVKAAAAANGAVEDEAL